MNAVAMRPVDSVVCSNCAGDRPRVRMDKRSSVWISCTGCMARTVSVEVVDNARAEAIEHAWRLWRREPLIAPPVVRPEGTPARLQRRSAKDEADPLELLARLLVPSSYRVPVEGRSSRPGMTMADIAAALGFMRDRLAKAVAIAVATRADEAYIARLTELARWRVRREVLTQRPVPLKLSQPADRWKLRLALFDAAHELVWPEKRTPYGLLAKRTKMRKADYIVVHRCATHVLQEALNNARVELKKKLRGG